MRRNTRPLFMVVTGSLLGVGLLAVGCGSSGSTGSSTPDGGSGSHASGDSGNGSSTGSFSLHPSMSSTGTNTASTNTNGSATTTATGATDGGGGGDSGSHCSPPIGGMDAGQFPSGCCSKGPAACVPTSNVPPSLQSAFSTCTDGLCVPDEIIAAGSSYVATSCMSSLGAGVCLSGCIPEIGNSPDFSLLSQGSCITGDVCVPCINPLTSMPTGACSLKVTLCGSDAGSPSDAGDAASGPTCPYTGPPLVDPSSFPQCMPSCNGAHCVPAALVPASDASQLATCTASGGAAGYCAPDSLVESGGQGVPPTCTSIAGAEGRCLSTCLPAVAAEAFLLPTAGCSANEACVPCYNPTSADPRMPTGACSLACDMPADPPTILSCPYTGPQIIDPSIFGPCMPSCGGAHCVPSSLVAAAEQSQLATCTTSQGGDGYCAPDSITEYAGEAVPPTCKSVAGVEGRCLSTCLPAIAAEADILPQSTCASGEVCAPCYNPTASDPDTPTGACSLGCDMPADPPTTLSCPWKGADVIDPSQLGTPCCTGAHCLPAAYVPAAEQSELASCTDVIGGPGYCTPDPIIAAGGNYVPPTCDPFPGSDFEGRCLSLCLTSVDEQSATLQQSTCASGELCAPCYDPFVGTVTPACTTSCDKPVTTAAQNMFPTCCNNGTTNVGTCVPSVLVPSAEQSELDYSGNGNSATCPQSGPDYLCVPDEYLPAPYNSIAIQFCQATILDICAVCVSLCVNFSSLEGDLTTSDCPPNDVAVECGLASDIATAPPGCYGDAGFCNSGTICGGSCSDDSECGPPCPNCDIANGSICDNLSGPDGGAPEDN